jgi:hypothetical protein
MTRAQLRRGDRAEARAAAAAAAALITLGWRELQPSQTGGRRRGARVAAAMRTVGVPQLAVGVFWDAGTAAGGPAYCLPKDLAKITAVCPGRHGRGAP